MTLPGTLRPTLSARRLGALSASCRFIDDRLARFCPHEPGLTAVGWTKRLTELSMICAFLHTLQAGSPLLRPHLAAPSGRWIGLAGSLIDDAGRLRAAAQDVDGGLYLVQPYLWLRETGWRCPAADDAVRSLQRRGARPRSVGELHSLWRAGLLRTAPDWAAWCRHHVVARRAAPLETLNPDAYRITHAIFYATDFGARPLPLSAPERSAVEEIVHRLLRRSHRHGRHDLTQELLLCNSFVGHAGCAACDRAEVALGQARRTDAGVPNSAGTTDADEFRSAYHTTLLDIWRNAVVLAAPTTHPAQRGRQLG